MKILNNQLNHKFSFYGTISQKSKNFQINYSGYLDAWVEPNNRVICTEDVNIEETQVFFRGDLVEKPQVLMQRFFNEGFTELKKEYQELNNNLNLFPLVKAKEKYFKELLKKETIYFRDEFTKEESMLLKMKHALSSFETQLYNRRKDVCNSQFGFNFEGENLDKEFVNKKEFKERYKFLKKEFGGRIKELLK